MKVKATIKKVPITFHGVKTGLPAGNRCCVNAVLGGHASESGILYTLKCAVKKVYVLCDRTKFGQRCAINERGHEWANIVTLGSFNVMYTENLERN